MAKRKPCKIDQIKGLSDRIQGLVSDGVSSRHKILAVISSEFPSISVSAPTIGRYVAQLKKSAEGKAFKIISDHVDKVVPKDLEALENMERVCLQWSDEAAKDQIERVAKASEKISGEIDQWLDVFIPLVEKRGNPNLEFEVLKSSAVLFVIKKCLQYLAQDDRRQEERLKAMRMATQIIELKLSKAGLLSDQTKGRIVLLKREESSSGETPPTESKRPIVLHGGSHG